MRTNDMRTMRAKVFQRTVAMVTEGYYITPNGKRIEFPDDTAMMQNTKFYSEPITVENLPFREIPTVVRVENIDCLYAAKELLDKKYNPAVLNMASRQNPGGGVHTGSAAQEENLFRRSNLFKSMFRFASYADSYGLEKSLHQYPLDRNFGGIYIPDAIVFRDSEQKGYALLENYYSVSFITVPGVNRPELDAKGLIIPALIEPVKNKIRTIFRIGLAHGHDSLVLGALGCGAFKNPPAHIAKLFHEVMNEEEFKNKYRLLYFAILEDHNSGCEHNPDGNLLPFYKEFIGDKD